MIQSIGSKVKNAAELVALAKGAWDIGRSIYQAGQTIAPIIGPAIGAARNSNHKNKNNFYLISYIEMFGKLNRHHLNTIYNNTKKHLGNVYHHTKDVLGHIDNGINVGRTNSVLFNPTWNSMDRTILINTL